MSTDPVDAGDGTRGASRRTIDCDECVMEGSTACDDCLVTFVVGREPGDALVVDVEEARALKVLCDRGLVPGLRHRARAG